MHDRESGAVMEENEYSRRQFVASGIAATALLPARAHLPAQMLQAISGSPATNPGAESSTVLKVDFRSLVSHADLNYTEPVTRSEAGQPLGNGQMGSLVWTTPTTVNLQVNRIDVYAQNKDTHSFPERNTDYGSGCAYVDLNLCDFGEDVFGGSRFNQHLSVYDGMVKIVGNGVLVRLVACQDRDVFAIEIDDRRPQPAPIHIDLRMLRYVMQYIAGENFRLAQKRSVEVVTHNQSSASTLAIRDGQIVLQQEFREGNYYNASAVVARVVGRRSKAKYANETTVRLGMPAERGKFTVLIASAASFDPQVDVAKKAVDELDAIGRQGFDALASVTAEWWHGFWSKAFVHMETSDPGAREIERSYTYYLYVMSASSRGAFIPKYGGMLWFTNGDMRAWGAQHWWHNASCDYNALPVANRSELMQPLFRMYSGMYESSARAARQQWGSEGIFIPEVTWFDGLEELPEDIAEEMRALYLMRKPWEERSERFRYFAEPKTPHNSRWNWKDRGKWVDGHFVWKDRGFGPYGPVTHILSSGAKIAHLYWQHYEHTQDEVFLREIGYPILKGVAEFYRNFPNLQRGDDGKYHIHRVNNHEPVLGATDTQEEIAAIRGLLPAAARAAEILQVDSDLRAKWAHLVENLAPLPTSFSPGSTRPRKPSESEVWIAGLPPVLDGNIGSVRVIPAIYYDLCCVETEDDAIRQIAAATFEAMYPTGINADTQIAELTTDSMAAANLGRSEDIRHMLLSQIVHAPAERDYCDWDGTGPPAVLPNRMTLREGPGAIGVQRLGRMAEAMQASLLQSAPAKPGGDPILHVFPAWPKDWDVQYTLSARGGFVVTSSRRRGQVEFVELHSRAGQPCRLRNPWGDDTVTLFRNGKKAEDLSGAMLRFATQKQEQVVVVPTNATPFQFARSI
jgi:hypothetical protein